MKTRSICKRCHRLQATGRERYCVACTQSLRNDEKRRPRRRSTEQQRRDESSGRTEPPSESPPGLVDILAQGGGPGLTEPLFPGLLESSVVPADPLPTPDPVKSSFRRAPWIDPSLRFFHLQTGIEVTWGATANSCAYHVTFDGKTALCQRSIQLVSENPYPSCSDPSRDVMACMRCQGFVRRVEEATHDHA